MATVTVTALGAPPATIPSGSAVGGSAPAGSAPAGSDLSTMSVSHVITDPGPIKLGQQSYGAFYEVDRLDVRDPALAASNNSFKALWEKVRELPDHQTNHDLTAIPGWGVVLDDGKLITRDELAEMLVDHITPPPATPADRDTAKAQIAKEIDDHLQNIKIACDKSGIASVAYYPLRGPDLFASRAGGMALCITDTTAKLIQDQQALDLFLDADKSKHDISEFIENTCSTDDEKHTAKTRVLTAEAFVIALRKELTDKIDELTQADPQDPNIDHYTKMLTEMDQINRSALYMGAIHNDDGDPNAPEKCYEKVLSHYHKAVCAEIGDPKKRPSIQKFKADPSSYGYKHNAAETASLLALTPGDYRRFCDEHQITVRDSHPNRYINRILRDGPSVDAAKLDICLPESERDEFKRMTNKALQEADTAVSQVIRITKGKSVKETIKTALNNSAVFHKFLDPSVYHPNFFVRKFKQLAQRLSN